VTLKGHILKNNSPRVSSGPGRSLISTIAFSLHCTVLAGNILQCPLEAISSQMETCYSSLPNEFYKGSINEICQYVSVLFICFKMCVISEGQVLVAL